MTYRQGSLFAQRIRASALIFAIIMLAGCLRTQSAAPLVPPTPTVGMQSPTPAIQATPTAEIALSAQPTIQPSPIPTESALPLAAMITDIIGHEQTYELGCEASAAVDWAGYYDVLIYESTFQFALPLSDNPELGFVGNVTTDGWGQIPPDAYGVHAPPIAELLREYGLPAKAVEGMTLEEVKTELAEGDPVIAWVIGNMEYSSRVKVFDKQGNAVIVAPFEHVVILTGYDEANITYLNNGLLYSVPIEVFLTSWSVLGNMAVIHE